MKIMVVNSMPMFENNKGLFIYKETGKFLVELSQAGCEVIVFQFRMKAKNTDFLADYDISNKELQIVSVKRRRSKLWAYIKALLIGIKTVNKVDFYYLFYPSNFFFEFLAFICLIFGKKIGLYVRGEQGIMSSISRFLYKKAEVILTISPKFTERICNNVTNAYTIRPMIDFSEDDIILHREYKPQNIYYLLFVGRIERAKGVYEICNAIQSLVDNGIHNFRMHMIGDGVDTYKLKELAEKQQLSKFIIFHGTITNREQLSIFYEKADLFIFPSHHEGFPRVLYEAMIFGVPIISTFVGSISYLLKDGYNSIRIEPKDAKNLSAKIKYFLKDYEKNSAIAKSGTKTIMNYLANKKDRHATQLIKSIKNINYV